jgi:nitrogen fixation protein FixH
MKRGTAWPLAVSTILALTVAGNIWLIRVATNDPSFAIEEDYYQRGVHWDTELAQRATNRALGWSVVATLTPDGSGGGTLRIALADSLVAPIEGASVVVKAAHVGRARHTIDVSLAPAAPGEYQAQLPIERAGLWELRIDVHRGRDRFTATERLDVSLAQP